MGDVAQILSSSLVLPKGPTPTTSAAAETAEAQAQAAHDPATTNGTRKRTPPPRNQTSTSMVPPPPPPPSHHPSRSMKMNGLSKEVMELLSGTQDKPSAALPPIVPSFTTTTSTRKTVARPPARPWVWAPFASSARTDGALYHHWVRAGVEYPDYPYARFDIHLDPVTYTDKEYQTYLHHPTWTKSETDRLMELARRYELRWVIIDDRWLDYYDNDNEKDDGTVAHAPQHRTNRRSNRRRMEELQYRYYSVAAILSQRRVRTEAGEELDDLLAAAAASTTKPTTTTTTSSTLTNHHTHFAPPPPSTTTAASMAALPQPITTVDPTTAAATASKDQAAAAGKLVETIVMEQAAARSIATVELNHQPFIATIGTGSSNKHAFDLQKETERRTHMELLWNRTKEEELEEVHLRKELRLVEAQIRKLKKSGGHILAAAATSGGGGISSLVSSRNGSRSVTPVPPSFTAPGGAPGSSTTATLIQTKAQHMPTNASTSDSELLDQCFASTAPTPMPQTPYLQSGRLVPPATGGPVGLNKTTLKRMEDVLEQQLNIPPRPVPTKRVCDLYDAVRKDVLTLLTLQKMVLQKEGQLQNRRLRLSKLGGRLGSSSTGGGRNSSTGAATMVVNEEALLGIVPAPPPVPVPSIARTKGSGGGGGGGGGGKPKTSRTGTSKKSGSTKSSNDSGTTGGGDPNDKTTKDGTVKKKTVKRKKKTEGKASVAAGHAQAAGAAGAPTLVAQQVLAAAGTKGGGGGGDNDGKPTKKRARKT